MQKWEYLRLINERDEDDTLFYWQDLPEVSTKELPPEKGLQPAWSRRLRAGGGISFQHMERGKDVRLHHPHNVLAKAAPDNVST